MKKLVALMLGACLTAGMMTGCGAGKSTASEAATTPATQVAATESAATETAASETIAATGEAAKTGLAVISSVEKSVDAGAEDGLAQTDSTVVAVLVDGDGKILACEIDAAQTKINFSKEGKLVTDVTAASPSKRQLGDNYGMKKASTIGKEWYEQADAFAAYAVGKTVDELKGIAMDDKGVATEADLTASVTVKLGGFISAIEKAVANAQDLGAATTDKLGLAVSTEMSKSTDVADGKDGLAQAYSTYAAVTTDADGKITSCYIDASQSNVNFDATGKITSDLTAALQTKQELGESYGMKKASAIGKEWNEQADAFAAYTRNKTAEEVKGIAVNAEGLAGDADLISSVTVHIAPFMSVVATAAENSAK